MPLFSRVGPYQLEAIDQLANARTPKTFEYWGHEAAFLPIETWPLWQWRMQAYQQRQGRWHTWATENAPFVHWLRDEVAANGPTTARAVNHHRNQRSGSWWGWSDVKQGLEWLFLIGELTSAGRSRFERVYATPEQAIPRHIRALEVPSPDEARRQLVATAARNLGVFTLADAADYFRMTKPEAAAAIHRLQADGEIDAVTVDGWRDEAWMHTKATVPRRVDVATFLSPFDPLVWFRPRTERIFDFHYRIEIYTPEPQRVYGYYTLPYLLNDKIVARLDLKSDRQSSALRVKSAWAEQDPPPETASTIAHSLREAARWQNLDDIVVEQKGTLARELAQAIADA